MAEQTKTKTFTTYGISARVTTFIDGSSIYARCNVLGVVGGKETGILAKGFKIQPTVQKKVGSSWVDVETLSGNDFWFTKDSPVTIGFHNYGRYGNTLRIRFWVAPGERGSSQFNYIYANRVYYNTSTFTM